MMCRQTRLRADAHQLHGWLFVLYPATSMVQGLVWQTGFTMVLWVAVAGVMTGRAGRGSGLSLQRPLTRDAFVELR